MECLLKPESMTKDRNIQLPLLREEERKRERERDKVA
jgi:hypothetical protein